MPSYQIIALDPKNKEVERIITAPDESRARSMAERQKLEPLHVHEISRDEITFGRTVSAKKLNAWRIWQFCERLAPLKEQNIPDQKTMEFFVSRVPDEQLRLVGKEVLEKLGDSSLVEAICETKKFSPLVEGCLLAGQESATLDSSFKLLARFYEMQVEMKSSIIMTMMEPVLAMAVIFIFILFTLFVSAPKMGATLKNVGYPPGLPLAALMTVSHVILIIWPLVLLLVVGGTVFLVRPSPLRTKFFEWIFKRFSPLGEVVYGLRQTAFCYCASALLASKVPTGRCFSYLIEVAEGTPFADELRNAQIYHTESGQLSTALERSTSLDPEIVFSVKIGEQSASIAEQLLKAAEVYEKKTIRSAQMLSKKLGPLVTVIGGGMAGAAYLATFGSMFSMCDKLMRGGH